MNETAERLMDLAEAHMRNKGYGGFSFRDLAAELGIRSASVHEQMTQFWKAVRIQAQMDSATL